LRGANLSHTQFISCDLLGAHLDGAILNQTHFGHTKLANGQGLDKMVYKEISYIDHFSLITSLPLPEPFLNACNVNKYTLAMAKWHLYSRPFYKCFISYSRRDESFAGYLREALTWASIPSWFAPHDMRDEEFQSGDQELERDLYNYLDEAERFLLILSPNILSSHWMAKEYSRRASIPLVAILIEDMPEPYSEQWNDRVARIKKQEGIKKNTLNNEWVKDEEYGDRQAEIYADSIASIIRNKTFLDFRDWRNPLGFAYYFKTI
jgi:hypothetical protein